MIKKLSRLLWMTVTTLLLLWIFAGAVAELTKSLPLKDQVSDKEWFQIPISEPSDRDEMLYICKGEYSNGRAPTKEALSKILQDHAKWLKNKQDGKRANLCKANLSGFDLREANLSGALIFEANLTNSDLSYADLSKANLNKANLTEASLGKTNLSEAILIGANLTEASMIRTNLQKANLLLANLKDAKIFWADLNLVESEPIPGSLPYIFSLTSAKNLSTMRFFNSPSALIDLREAFKKAGMRKQEREITYAIRRSERFGMDFVEREFNWLLFDLTSQYGMSPQRPLQILALLILLFSIPYMFALQSKGKSGIWAIWPADRVHKEKGEQNPSRVTENFFFPHAYSMWWEPGRGTRLILGSLYFSILSAFNIGWRDLNVGAWITRIQTREYFLRATGWVRSASGIQSLISVYLLALWFLTYFGRPFE